MASGAASHLSVFVSYSHKDERWKDRLVTQLGVLQQQGLLEIWDDRLIGAGEDWERRIQDSLARARVAILLVTANFLTSNFILLDEVPRLLQRRDREGVRIFPVIVSPCAWQHVEWLKRMNVRPKDGKPLSGGRPYQIEKNLASIAEEVATIVEGPVTDQSSASLTDQEQFRSSSALEIDDVIVKKGQQHVVLDVRLRNTGNSVVNLTRVDLHVFSRMTYAALYRPSASYDLLLQDEHNLIPIAHILQPNEFDSFLIRVGFTEGNTSCGFTAELVLYYNKNLKVVSEPFEFDSSFE